ncbi:MAG: hypothetical protein MUO82_00275 [Candidatus Thermoplasmatota archaeon]|nr:hypothetical protein [Candidatus Thermoplasmatota archaeon]
MQIFSKQTELIEYAKTYVKVKVNGLEEVVNHCLYPIPGKPGLYATFPAILYCFAIINLLGALYEGNATKSARIFQAKKYMQKFMNYTPDQCDLLMDQFRHKIAHLSEPKAVIESKGRYIAWEYEHNRSQKHLTIEKLSGRSKIQITSRLSIGYDHVFHISIVGLVDNIKASVDLYLNELENTIALQNHFEKAVREIYDYK